MTVSGSHVLQRTSGHGVHSALVALGAAQGILQGAPSFSARGVSFKRRIAPCCLHASNFSGYCLGSACLDARSMGRTGSWPPSGRPSAGLGRSLALPAPHIYVPPDVSTRTSKRSQQARPNRHRTSETDFLADIGESHRPTPDDPCFGPSTCDPPPLARSLELPHICWPTWFLPQPIFLPMAHGAHRGCWEDADSTEAADRWRAGAAARPRRRPINCFATRRPHRA